MFKRRPIHIHFNAPIVELAIAVDGATSPEDLKDRILKELEVSVDRALKMAINNAFSITDTTPASLRVSVQSPEQKPGNPRKESGAPRKTTPDCP